MILSVIVPIYNSSKYIYKCLQSLMSITLSDVEFLLIDDGSIDNSASICRQFVEKDKRFFYYYKCNGGVATARNYGLDICKGKYILFLDSDDYINRNIINAISFCEKYGISFLILRRYYITRDCNEFEYNLDNKLIFENKEKFLYKVRNLSMLLNIKIFVSGSAEILFRRDLTKDIRMDETLNLLEDVDFFLKILYKGDIDVYFYNKTVTFINDEVCGSLTKKKAKQCDLHLGTINKNPYLLNNDKFRRKILWFEAYFHSKKMNFLDRVLYFIKYRRMLFANIYICKYLCGCLFLLFMNMDINRIKIFCQKIFKSKKL